MSKVKQGIDWAGSAQTIWAFFPVWLKAAVVTAASVLLATLQHLPWAAVFVLSLIALAFGLIAILMINEWIRTRNEADAELQLSKPRPKVMPVFHQRFSGSFVSDVYFDYQFKIENLGEEAAVNVVVHEIPLTGKTIRFASVTEPLRPMATGNHRVGLDLVIGAIGDLETSNDLCHALVEEMAFVRGGASPFRCPLVISYCDANGRRFETRGSLVCDRSSRTTFFEFERSVYIPRTAA